jgi:hypothetical protein
MYAWRHDGQAESLGRCPQILASPAMRHFLTCHDGQAESLGRCPQIPASPAMRHLFTYHLLLISSSPVRFLALRVGVPVGRHLYRRLWVPFLPDSLCAAPMSFCVVAHLMPIVRFWCCQLWAGIESSPRSAAGFSSVMFSSLSLGVECCVSMIFVLCCCGSSIGCCGDSVCKCMYVVLGVGGAGGGAFVVPSRCAWGGWAFFL